MLIWLLALVLMASLAGLGYRQGAIRVGFSFLGILLGALLAFPLGKVFKILLLAFGMQNPVAIWLLGAFLVFVIFSVIFKVSALVVHQKVDVYYKYHAGDLRLALWERLNRRVGLCLGILNGAAYFLLISWVIYGFSYWTYQMSSEQDPGSLRILNRLGAQLHSTGFARAAHAIDPLPQVWYDSADLAGLIYRNPLTEARLSRYPAFLSLAERQEFQALGSDKNFADLRQAQDTLLNTLNNDRVASIIGNPDLLKVIWDTVVPDMQDLRVFLETANSPKYGGEKILGRWRMDINSAVNTLRRARPNLPAKEIPPLRRLVTAAFEKANMVVMTDSTALLKNCPPLRLPPAANASSSLQTFQGHWKGGEGKYLLTFSVNGTDQEMPATIEGDRLTLTADGVGFTFTRED